MTATIVNIHEDFLPVPRLQEKFSKEGIGKSTQDVLEFFNRFKGVKGLTAYLLHFNKEIVIKDNEDERTVNILKGWTLEPLKTVLEEGQHYLIESRNSKYHFFSGILPVDEQERRRILFNRTILELLRPNFNPKKVITASGRYVTLGEDLQIPKDMLEARLLVSYATSHCVDTYPRLVVRELALEGKDNDSLFESLSDFCRYTD